MQKEEKQESPCDYCANPKNEPDFCYESCCYTYSRWINNGKAPASVKETVDEFHFDRF